MTNKIYKGIKPTRQLLQVTQSELAERLGKRSAHLSVVETGRHNGSIPLYEKICDALELPFVVIAMEALQIEEIEKKDMEEFLKIKEELYRFLGVTRVLKEKMDIVEGRKLAERLWQGKQLKKSLRTQE